MEKHIDGRALNGGKRDGAGRPKLINDPVVVGFRVEREIKDKLRAKYGKTLTPLFNAWVKKMLKKEVKK